MDLNERIKNVPLFNERVQQIHEQSVRWALVQDYDTEEQRRLLEKMKFTEILLSEILSLRTDESITVKSIQLHFLM